MRLSKTTDFVVSALLLVLACIVLAICLFFARDLQPLPLMFKTEITECAAEFNLDKSLVAAVCFAESSFRESVVSNKGAMGLMQLMPSTAVWLANKIDYPLQSIEMLNQAQTNIYLGCAYLSYLKNKFSSEKTVLSAYNAGEGTVGLWLSNKIYSCDGETLLSIPYAETANYIKKVEKARAEYAKDRYWKV